MYFEKDITVEKLNLVSNKKKVSLKLTKGVIVKASFYFPPGCQNMVRVTLNEGGHQVYPLNPDGYIKGDSISVEGPDFQMLLKEPYTLDIYGWNTGATYPHTITCRFWLLKIWQIMPFSDEMFNLSLREDQGLL